MERHAHLGRERSWSLAVDNHEDLAGLLRGLGLPTIAHPWVYSMSGEVAVMVSGNAMAHVYLDLPDASAMVAVAQSALERDSRDVDLEAVGDLMILPKSLNECEVHGNGVVAQGWCGTMASSHISPSRAIPSGW